MLDYIIIGGIILFVFVLLIYCITFRNSIVAKKENIEKAKSKVRIAKAKYLQVLRKVGSTQKASNKSHGKAYSTANSHGNGWFIGGAIGSIDSNFDEASDLVISLANEYQKAQQSLNTQINQYNLYISKFPRVILAKLWRCKKESYIDSENLNASLELHGFEEEDI